MIKYNELNKSLTETEYDIKNEQIAATLFTTGNGYFGVRGSFEEFGSIGVQGSYLRGLMDEIIELPTIGVDNIYMRKYYFDEEKARTFQTQESCINFCDFTFMRFKIGDYTFYPWEGKILKWQRYIDTESGVLNRIVVWEDPNKNQTKLHFKRYASFADNHIYTMEVKLKKLNHHLPVVISSGIDILAKTNGQIKTDMVANINYNNVSGYQFKIGNLYRQEVSIIIKDSLFPPCSNRYKESNGRYFNEFTQNGSDELVINKTIYAASNIDGIDTSNLPDFIKTHISNLKSEDVIYQEHLLEYKKRFHEIDIQIYGNDEDNALLKYANYQTLIGIDRFGEVHGLSAKNLSGDKYNQFVWWDAEIYQLPVFFATMPEVAKKSLMYRVNRLKEAKANAKKEGFNGAKFAFCSGVTGEELVWSYVRHPFMQIHINTDIAYSIIRYYIMTKDINFFREYGIEVISEILKYFISRVNYNEHTDKYEINQVTGTDEHHPYVNNNTYTNFTLKYVIQNFFEISKSQNISFIEFLSLQEIKILRDIQEKLVVQEDINGVTPQFDGYLLLNPKLEVTGNGAAKGFQMKESGLYHLSQIIKQPDLLMLYSYLNVDFNQKNFQKNWKYYENKCEKSSSLSYPVHAICAIDNLELDKFYSYFHQTLKIDIDDIQGVASQGIHAACLAGGWYIVYRGIFGVKENIDYLQFNPKIQQFYDKIAINFYYQGIKISAELTKENLIINAIEPINIKINNATISGQCFIKYNLEEGSVKND